MVYCIKNAHCLKNKYGIKALKTYIKFVIEKNITYSNRNTYTFYTDRDSDVFKIAIKNKKNSKDESEDCPYINLYIYKIDPNGRDIVTKFCLWMCLKQNYKQEDGFYYFKTSYIKQINKGKCSVKDPNGELGGNYLLKLANSINKIFKVKHSTLYDDSSLKLAKGKIIKLKTLKLLQYQKTWYERVIGFKLDNKRIYQLAKIVSNIPLSSFLNIVLDEDLRKMTELWRLNEKDINSILEILNKVNLNKNSTFGEISRNIFNNFKEISNEEKYIIWNKLIATNYKRVKVKESTPDKDFLRIVRFGAPQPNPEDIKNYKLLMEWWPYISQMSQSSKTYVYTEKQSSKSKKKTQKTQKSNKYKNVSATSFSKLSAPKSIKVKLPPIKEKKTKKVSIESSTKKPITSVILPEIIVNNKQIYEFKKSKNSKKKYQKNIKMN